MYTEKELKEMINSEHWSVRAAVAYQGYGLDKLINDKHWAVRVAVATQRYGLDKLINDEDPKVRAEVADQGYGLDKLINDENWYVRATVAEQGYGLDKLVNDKNHNVRRTVKNKAHELNGDEFNMNNGIIDILNGTTNINEIVHRETEKVEMGNFVLQLEMSAMFDEKTQKTMFNNLCKITTMMGANVPIYCEDMEKAYSLYIEYIDKLIKVEEDEFQSTLTENLELLLAEKCLDSSDIDTINFLYNYINRIYVNNNIKHAKRLLSALKVYLTTVYNFVTDDNYREE